MGNVSPWYKGHRYPAEVISHCVWLYHRFPRSFRDVEELMMERGVVVSYDTVRRWCAKFGQAYARELRRRQPRAGDKWHLDEVFIKINSEQKYLWRAVDQDGTVLHILVLCTPWPSPATPPADGRLRGRLSLAHLLPRQEALAWATAFLAPLHDLPKTPVDVTRLAVTFPRSAVAPTAAYQPHHGRGPLPKGGGLPGSGPQ
ncbi:IS6 family transposase [Streptomyces sp. NPDC001388]|uniref:IS6 family transposase n=1 Tax=Streptomyces sp. NPDC001388 TaxID=3364568 RepID=UPI003684CAD9